VTNAALQFSGLASFGAQLLIDLSDTNIIAASLALGSSTVTLQYLRLSKSFATLPLSSFALLGFCVTTQWGALVAQSAAWTPIAENLRDPIRTFGMLGLFQCVVILAHLLHRTLRPLVQARDFGSKALARLGIFEIPAPGSLWFLGAVGFAAYAIAASPGEVDLGDRLLAGFWPFAWAPFLIPILHLRYGSAYCNLRLQGALLGVYALMAFGLAMALNYRVLMIQGAFTAGLLAFLVALQDERPFRARVVWILALLALVAAVAAGPIADLATAMVITRGDRGHVSPVELFKRTVDAFQDKQAIQRYRETAQSDSRLSAYDETYLANPLIARLVETKYYDNTLFFTKDLSFREREGVVHEVIDRAWAMFPYPVLRALKIPGDKRVLGYSLGDYYAHLSVGTPLAGFRTGTMLADFMVLFGEAGPVFYLLLCLALLLFMDAQCLTREGGQPQISVFAMLQTYRLFTYGVTNESVDTPLGFFVRGFWQTLALYVLTYWMTKIVFPPFRPSAGARAPT
jgi:hypothetical protein